MVAIPFFVDPDAPTLLRWLDHFDHAVAVMGIEHVGLGADFVDQVKPDEQPVDANAERQSELAQVTKARLALDDFRGPDDFPALVTALRARGYEGSRLEAMLSGNWLRILRDGLPA